MAELKGFMGKMREGDMRGIVANLQAALNFSQECLRVYAEKLEEAFKIGMTAKVEGEVGRRMSRLVHGEPRVLSKKEVEDGIEAVIKALMEEIGVDESDGE